jgi:hypothetical protein
MEPTLTMIASQRWALDQAIAERLAIQKKRLAEQRKKIPEFPNRDFVGHSQFLHTSNQFALPIQNWKEGTPFYRDRGPKKQRKNIHSAAAQRSRRYPLEQEERDFILHRRYEIAELEMPLHCGVFEVVPTHKAELDFSHKCIWKEYM